ncbi:MAG: peroxiredoxin [Planctomycetes bacterium]|nr:peroxiredoxin [Planctomycetota bacterium]
MTTFPLALAPIMVAGCSGGSGHHGPPPAPPSVELRSIDGTANNQAQVAMGSVSVPLVRMLTQDYADGASTPAGPTRPSARAVSNAVHAQTGSVLNSRNATDMFWLWGQFVDHDIDLTPPATPAEPFAIPVPTGDAFFDPNSTGTQTIGLDRSVCVMNAGARQQLNRITAWLDGSGVYGSDAVRAAALRANDGTGHLRLEATPQGALLPRNTGGLPNDGPGGATLFLAGDVRANENVLLTAMHTLFVREHNLQADRYRQLYPGATGDQLYDLARRWVGAEIQAITYEEWLPLLLGAGGIPSYSGYDAGQQGGIANAFSTACYRFGHSLLSTQLQRLDAGLNPIAQGHLALRDGFFSPTALVDGGGIEPLLRGAARQQCQEMDVFVVDEVRNFLFGPPGSGGLDLAALNIQRGRDHGLPSYNAARTQLGLSARASFAQVTTNPTTQAALMSVYATVDEVDLWTGALAEDRLSGSMVGELMQVVLSRQFALIRDCDRFFYLNQFSGQELADLRGTRLIDVIRRNTPIGNELQASVFVR